MTKRKYYLPAVVLIIGVLAVAFLLRKKEPESKKVFVEVKPIQSSFGWGYEILADGKLYIHQEIIPAFPGKQGFKSKEDALKVGRLVLLKIGRNEMPPSVTREEIKDLGISMDPVAVK